MKKSLLYIALLAAYSSAAQDSTQTAANTPASGTAIQFKALKNNDQVLPRWALDVTYKYGSLAQDIEMIDLKQSYTNQLSSTFSTPSFSKGTSHGASLQLGYFFGKNRRWGLGTGVSVFLQKGTLTIDDFKTQYQSTDENGTTFRQILTSKGAVTEEVRSTNITIPLVLKFKHQFKESNFGLSVDLGGFAGISNQNKFDAQSRFDYEAAYKYENGVGVYDASPNFDGASQLITREHYLKHQTEGVPVNEYFQRKFNEGHNVALDREIRKEGSTSYSKMSYGFIFQPSVTYYLGYHTTFLLGGYYTYHVFGNEGNDNYRLTDKVGEYRSITEGVKRNVATSWGLNVGFRFFFGEKRDVDGDGVADKVDNCPLEFGDLSFMGCPDFDKDGILDRDDECRFDYGSETANGCPDRDGDGIADSKDACPDEPGKFVDDPALNGCPQMTIAREWAKRSGATVSEKPVQAETIETYFDVLQSNMINFDFGKSEVHPSSFTVLDDAAAKLAKNAKIMIIVSGHTDSVGSYAKNMKLSFDRANAVSNYLQNKGVSRERIIAVGYGTEKPLTSNNSPENRAQNRRTEMQLVIPVEPKK
jgi:outer membrane protein OmpA-like peptidoglycan-associated protein